MDQENCPQREVSGERAKAPAPFITSLDRRNPVSFIKIFAPVTALALLATPAAAITVKNSSAGEITIGIDMGDKEKVETVAAGKSVKFDCKGGCGVTGPWGFSWMASGDDEIETDGTALVTVMDEKAGKAASDK
jgi:hypothetical protein